MVLSLGVIKGMGHAELRLEDVADAEWVINAAAAPIRRKSSD